MRFQYLNSGDSSITDKVLRSLPDWFGIESSTQEYISKSKELPMIVAYEEDNPVGFVSVKFHSKYTAEVYIMGVIPDYHRKSIGKDLLIKLEEYLKEKGFEFLQVKTVDESKEDKFYSQTRLFYKAQGFREVEVFPNLWDAANPCLMLIRSLEKK